MSGAELAETRRRLRIPRTEFCALIGRATNTLSLYEAGRMPVPASIGRKVRQLRNETPMPNRVTVATFGEEFVVARLSRIEGLDVGQIDVLAMPYSTRNAAVIAAQDYARLHGLEYAPIGF